MEKTILKGLTEKEKALLAELSESASMDAMLKALALYQLEKAKWVVMSSPDHNYTLVNRGQVEGSRFIVDLCKTARDSEKKQKQISS